jgi:HKD family nuclease
MNDIFLTNYTEVTFLDKLKESIKKCNSFAFSVSFIKKAGLVLFENILEDALKRGVKGRIITSTYQNFTDTISLRTFLKWMNEYLNFECHLDINCLGEKGFHSKGYLFEYDDSYEFIVGSSNITRFALIKNIEWNVSLRSNVQMESSKNASKEFEELWKNTLKLSSDLIKQYQLQLDYAIDKWDMDFFDPLSMKIKPNTMQRRALKELRRYRYGSS